MSKILVDIYKSKDMYAGLGQFSAQYARALSKLAPKGFEIDFLVHKGGSPVQVDQSSKYIQAGFLQRYLPGLNPPYDLWHSLHQFPSHLPSKVARWVLTIHDLNFLKEKGSHKASRYLTRLQANVDSAHTVTTISEFAKSEILAHLDLKGKGVHVIHNGVELGTKVPAARPKFLPEGKFFFSIGIFTEKKNFKVLIPLLKRFPDHRLVLAGRSDTPYAKRVLSEAQGIGVADRLILPGKVSESEKVYLYKHCDAFLFPSLAEGFGMPPVEAMATGVPVFLSKATSLPEIGGEAAFYFDDFSPQAMGDLVESKLAEIAENRKVFAEKVKAHASTFSWDVAISKYVSIYEEVLS